MLGRRFNGNLMPLSPEFPLSNSTGTQASVVTFSNGFTAAWERPSNVVSSRFDLSGQPTSSEVVVSGLTGSAGIPDVAISGTSESVFVWQNYDQPEVDYTGSVNIGNMIENGGLAAAFDGNRFQDSSVCAAEAAAPLFNSVFAGKCWTTPMTISGASVTSAEVKVEVKAELSLIDFGCAKDRATPLNTLRADSGYTPPEVFAFCRGEVASYGYPQWDAWSLGVTLAELALGKYPFPTEKIVDGQTTKIGFSTRLEWTPEYYGELLSQISELRFPAPGSFWDLVKQLLAVNPKERLSIEGALGHPALQGVLSSNGVAEVLERLKKLDSVRQARPHVPKEQDINYIPRGFKIPPPKPGAYISFEPSATPVAGVPVGLGLFTGTSTSVELAAAVPVDDESYNNAAAEVYYDGGADPADPGFYNTYSGSSPGFFPAAASSNDARPGFDEDNLSSASLG